MRDRAVGRERERMLSNGNSNFEMKGDVNVGKFQKEHGLGSLFNPLCPHSTVHIPYSTFYILYTYVRR